MDRELTQYELRRAADRALAEANKFLLDEPCGHAPIATDWQQRRIDACAANLMLDATLKRTRGHLRVLYAVAAIATVAAIWGWLR